MGQGAEVAVIGGGVMGCSAAFWLTRMAPGLSVTVVERDPTWAQAATALSAASIRSQFSTEVNVKISRFGIDFVRNFPSWTGPAGEVSSLGLIENGYLFLTGSDSGAAIMREIAAMQRACGAATEVLSAAEIAARFPWVETRDVVAGSFGPRDEGWFDNMGLLRGLRNAARAQGARFVTGEVTGLEITGGRVRALRLADGARIGCDTALSVAGTRASQVAAMAGFAVPVEPRKRTVFVIDAPNARHPQAPLLIDRGFWLRPERAGHWLTATVPDSDGACDINDFEPELHLFEEVIWEQLYARCPGFDAVKVVRAWAGHYDYNTLDQNALLGTLPPVPNLFFAAGFSGHGLQQAAAVGRGMAELILQGGWQTLDLSDLSISRILAGTPLIERAVV
jgi:glycine/D-amino acid oxidase-like deaminating enzyme